MTTDFGTTPPAAPRSAKTNTLAIIALVCGIGSIFTCCLPEVGAFVSIGLGVVAVVLGYVALGQIRRTGEEGRPLALAGAIIGGIVAAVTIILLVLALAFGVAILQQLQQQAPGVDLPANGGMAEPGDAELGEPDADLGAPEVEGGSGVGEGGGEVPAPAPE